MIIVAGGIHVDEYLNSTEILSIGGSDNNNTMDELNYDDYTDEGNSTATWEFGPDLPKVVAYAAMVEDPARGSVILTGGWHNVHYDTLYKLEVPEDSNSTESLQWVELEQKLKVARYSHQAFLVPDHFAHCHLKA